MVERLFLAVPLGCLRFVIVVFPDHTHLLFLISFLIYQIAEMVFDCVPKSSRLMKKTQLSSFGAYIVEHQILLILERKT